MINWQKSVALVLLSLHETLADRTYICYEKKDGKESEAIVDQEYYEICGEDCVCMSIETLCFTSYANIGFDGKIQASYVFH